MSNTQFDNFDSIDKELINQDGLIISKRQGNRKLSVARRRLEDLHEDMRLRKELDDYDMFFSEKESY